MHHTPVARRRASQAKARSRQPRSAPGDWWKTAYTLADEALLGALPDKRPSNAGLAGLATAASLFVPGPNIAKGGQLLLKGAKKAKALRKPPRTWYHSTKVDVPADELRPMLPKKSLYRSLMRAYGRTDPPPALWAADNIADTEAYGKNLYAFDMYDDELLDLSRIDRPMGDYSDIHSWIASNLMSDASHHHYKGARSGRWATTWDRSAVHNARVIGDRLKGIIQLHGEEGIRTGNPRVYTTSFGGTAGEILAGGKGKRLNLWGRER